MFICIVFHRVFVHVTVLCTRLWLLFELTVSETVGVGGKSNHLMLYSPQETPSKSSDEDGNNFMLVLYFIFMRPSCK